MPGLAQAWGNASSFTKCCLCCRAADFWNQAQPVVVQIYHPSASFPRDGPQPNAICNVLNCPLVGFLGQAGSRGAGGWMRVGGRRGLRSGRNSFPLAKKHHLSTGKTHFASWQNSFCQRAIPFCQLSTLILPAGNLILPTGKNSFF